MNFWQVFIRVLPRRPLAAMGALWWHVTGRRVRARNRLRAAGAQFPFAYKFWMRNIERADLLEKRALSVPASWASKPRFTILVDGRGRNDADVDKTFRSIAEQAYPAATTILVASEPDALCSRLAHVKVASSWGGALEESEGEWIVPLLGGDQVSKCALFHFAEAVQAQPEAVVVYGDEDQVDSGGRRRRPFFKPRWNEELFLAQDYVSRACAISGPAARAAAMNKGISQDLSPSRLMLHVLRQTRGSIIHVPQVVAHLSAIDREGHNLSRLEAVAEHVAERGASAAQGPFASVKVTWPLPADLPLVSIIIPTRDKVDLLRACVDSILAKTEYRRFEILIVDNSSVEDRTLAYLENLNAHSSIRLIRYPGPYNYSAINNRAAREAKGSFLCLLNNDTEVVEEQWLTELMRYAVRLDIGAVGAKLLYADGTIQHAGVVVGIGEAAGHAHRRLPSDEQGYFAHPHLPQYVSAVTGACLVVDKRKFLTVGGLDEIALPIAYNDVDLCLKLERAGWRNVYVPHAVLIHHESKSRAKDHSRGRVERYRRELEVFQERWGAKSYDDPLLNPNLDRSSETFVIRF